MYLYLLLMLFGSGLSTIDPDTLMEVEQNEKFYNATEYQRLSQEAFNREFPIEEIKDTLDLKEFAFKRNVSQDLPKQNGTLRYDDPAFRLQHQESLSPENKTIQIYLTFTSGYRLIIRPHNNKIEPYSEGIHMHIKDFKALLIYLTSQSKHDKVMVPGYYEFTGNSPSHEFIINIRERPFNLFISRSYGERYSTISLDYDEYLNLIIKGNHIMDKLYI